MAPTSGRSLADRLVRAAPWIALGGGGALALLMAILGAFEARLDLFLGCPDIKPKHGETKAPHFCEDITSSRYVNRLAIRDLVNGYADTLLTWDKGAGDARQPLRPIAGSVEAAIIPETGAVNLNKGDLSRRGRIVAKIVSNASYHHGIAPGVNYVWADYGPLRGWRALIVPRDPRYPIAVLSEFKVDETRPDKHTPVGTIQLFDTQTEWQRSLSEAVKECKDDGKRACWVFSTERRHPKATASRAEPAAGGMAATMVASIFTDGWVYVTSSGCVCVGTKCHSLVSHR